MVTPDEFAKQMRIIFQGKDIDKEHAHRDADDYICKVLIQLGYGEGVEIFKNAPKWYA